MPSRYEELEWELGRSTEVMDDDKTKRPLGASAAPQIIRWIRTTSEAATTTLCSRFLDEDFVVLFITR